jgi:type IV secretory pathway TraG/TraD family ATPase VirD4
MRPYLGRSPELLAYWDELLGFNDCELAALGVTAFLSLWLGWFVIKWILITVLRWFGCSTPVLYSRLSIIPWRMLYRLYMQFAKWREQIFRFGRYSTGGFSGVFASLTLQFTKRKLYLGKVWAWGFGLPQSVGINITRHLAIFAMTGAGKTTLLITMLRLWSGSAWLIDPKGQITYALARCDKRREWVVFRPYEPNNTAQWNPFDDIKAAMEREGANAIVKWSKRISQSLIVTPEGTKQPYFTETSEQFFNALVMHIITYHPEEEHNLPFARTLICHFYRVYNDDGSLESTKEESRQLLYKIMDENPSFGEVISKAASAFISASGDTEASLLSTLQGQLQWLDDPNVAYMLMATTRPLSEAKTCNDVVFSFTLPVLSIRQELKPLVRLYTNFTVYTFESVPKKKGLCLCVIDEIQAQGYNETIEVALPVARSSSMIIVAIAQDVEGMRASYPNTYRSFIGNADATLWMASSHPDNLEQISKLLGKTTIIEKDTYSGRKHYREVNVMEPEQIGRFLTPESLNMIATRAGARPLKLKIGQYFRELPVSAYDADPDHKEPLLRRIARYFFNKKIN